MSSFLGGNFGQEGFDFGIFDFVPPAETIVGDKAYLSSDGGEYLVLSSASANFNLIIPYGVSFLDSSLTEYASPSVKVISATSLRCVVPQMPLDTYDVELSVSTVDSSTVEDMVKVLHRPYYQKTHTLRDGLLSQWATGAVSSLDEKDSITTEEYNFAQLTAAAGELLQQTDSYSPDGHSVLADEYVRGDSSVVVKSLYPFVSASRFTVKKGVVYSYSGFDDVANELLGVTIVSGEDADLPIGTAIYPLVV